MTGILPSSPFAFEARNVESPGPPGEMERDHFRRSMSKSEAFEWDGNELGFGGGTYVENGVMRGAEEGRPDPPRPLQIFTRCYGFSLTFPGTEIYGER